LFYGLVDKEVKMKNLKVLILIILFGLAVCGCRKENVDSETAKTTEEKISKEAVMGITIQWLGHASFRICYEDKIIYIDPWKLKESVSDATLVLVSHSHYDHYSQEDIAGISGPDTKLIASADVIAKAKAGEGILPGLTVALEGIWLKGVPAYNPDKQFHPKASNWVGFVIEIGSKRIYYAGDTELTEEMKVLEGIDVALLPVGGTYTMNAKEAAEATMHIKPKLAIPYHWGDIIGGRNDAERFAESAACEVKILEAGESVSF
jgi:L-ascorbate metabolism protein UlaG (beta-lactamase superfamily)